MYGCPVCALSAEHCLCRLAVPSAADLERSRRARLTRHELDQLEATEHRLEQLERGRAPDVRED